MKYQPSICSHQVMPASMNKLANLGDYVFDNGYIYTIGPFQLIRASIDLLEDEFTTIT